MVSMHNWHILLEGYPLRIVSDGITFVLHPKNLNDGCHVWFRIQQSNDTIPPFFQKIKKKSLLLIKHIYNKLKSNK